jgi:hypothetical protein
MLCRRVLRVWRYAYRLQGKQKTFTIGKYPDTSLSEARTSRDNAKKLVSAGIDPSQQKQIVKRQFDYALVHGKCSRNPAKDIRDFKEIILPI